jgi:serine/threonine-protein kinase
MANETWVEPPQGVADPSLTGAFVRGRRPLGRTTVLPRVDHDESGQAIVHPREARYAQDAEIGRGGIGVVLEARDQDIGRRVAIKQIRPDLKSEKATLRFAEEIRTIGRLDHPNIVPIHDVGADETGAPYFVMKYIEGQTLKALLDTLRSGDEAALDHWTFPRRIAVFRKVLEAVAFAHANGVVHRDLKPENIMVGEHGEVHVLDWGIAHRSALPDFGALKGKDPLQARITQTVDGALLGTPAYMSPEQAGGRPATEASDIYSLGVVLHEWLTLTHYLAEAPTLEDLIEQVGTTPHIPPAQLESPLQPPVPIELSWMTMGALAKDPAERYASVDAWLRRLDELSDGQIPVQCPASFQKHWWARLGTAIDQHPWGVLGGALAVAIGGGLFGLGLLAGAFGLGAVVF